MPVEVPEELDLPQDPLGVDEVLEGVTDLLNRDLLPRALVDGRADQTVRAGTYPLDLLIPNVDRKGMLLSHLDCVILPAGKAVEGVLRARHWEDAAGGGAAAAQQTEQLQKSEMKK